MNLQIHYHNYTQPDHTLYSKGDWYPKKNLSLCTFYFVNTTVVFKFVQEYHDKYDFLFFVSLNTILLMSMYDLYV